MGDTPAEVMADRGLYTPSEWGQSFHDVEGGMDGVHQMLGAGAAGPGKSMVLLMDPIAQVQVEHVRCQDRYHPHYHPWEMSTGWCLHLRRTRPMLDQTIARSQRIFRAIDPGAKYHSGSTTWTFSSGYRYQFGHCKDPGDWEIYMSNEYTYIGFDELVQFEKEQFDNIDGRLRSTDPVLRDMIKTRAATNPVLTAKDMVGVKIRDPQWVRKYFVEPHPDGKAKIRKKIVARPTKDFPDGEVSYRVRMYLPATLFDNPDPDFVRQFERNLLGKPAHIRNALLYGDWYVTEGAFYSEEWDPQMHVVKPYSVPYDWPCFRSMDWGYKRPGCVHWWAMDPDGNLVCFRELTFQGKTDAEVAVIIKEIETQEGLWLEDPKGGVGRSTIKGPADTQLWEHRGNTGLDKAATMAKLGVHWDKAAKGPGSRMSNAQLFLKRLQDHNNGQTLPGICFFNTCYKVRETIPAIQTSLNNPEEPGDGGDDHWHDSVLYACAHASHGRTVITTHKPVDPWAEPDERDTLDHGYDGYGSTI